MTLIELLLVLILIQFMVLLEYVRRMHDKMGNSFDSQAPVNAYGENLTDAIQNSIVRGQRGIVTHE